MSYDTITNIYCAIAFVGTVVIGMSLVFAVRRVKSFMDWIQNL